MKQPWEQDPEAWKQKSEIPEKEKIAALFACRIREFNVAIDKLNTALQRFGDMVRVLELIHGRPSDPRTTEGDKR